MIIGHLPAGYVYGYLLSNKIGAKYILLACIFGAMAPDFDMLYFYFIDNRQTHHHKYWSHYPIVWLTLGAIFCSIHHFLSNNKYTLFGMCFVGGTILHLMLDSIVGDIWWLAPFVNRSYALFTVSAVYKPWWLNFVVHWSFAFEITVSLVAVWLLKKESRNKNV